MSKRGEAKDPERAAASSLARTRREVRRWCAKHRTTRLATLTFADEPDLDGGWAEIEDFRRRLETAGIRQPLIVPEYGTQNGRLHFHCAMPDYVPKDKLAALWGLGFVDVRRLDRKNRQGARKLGARDQARICAGYVAGYVAKGGPVADGGEAPAAGGPLGMNRRRYSIPKGTRPIPVRFSCIGGLFDAWVEIERQLGHAVVEVWRSPVDDPEWRGPPMLLLQG